MQELNHARANSWVPYEWRGHGGPGKAILTTRLGLRERQVRLLVTPKAHSSLGEYLLREPSSGYLSNLKKVR